MEPSGIGVRFGQAQTLSMAMKRSAIVSLIYLILTSFPVAEDL